MIIIKQQRPRVYIAGSFKNAQVIQDIAAYLENEIGALIPVRWWDTESRSHKLKQTAIIERDFYEDESVQLACARDFGGVATCDFFILVVSGEPQTGSLVELGYALAHHKPTYILGTIKRSAMFAQCRHIITLREIINEWGPQNSVSKYECCEHCLHRESVKLHRQPCSLCQR